MPVVARAIGTIPLSSGPCDLEANGVQVVIEDYVHGKHAKIALLLVSSFIHVLVAATAVLAVLRIAMRSVG